MSVKATSSAPSPSMISCSANTSSCAKANVITLCSPPVKRLLLIGLVVVAFLLTITPARAHDPSKSYLNLVLTTNEIAGQWDLPLTDLQKVVPLDADKDGFVTWEEL